jgi:hypothetical protein
MKKTSLKTLIMVFAISLFASNIFAQGAYVGFNAGYGFGMGSFTASNSTYTQKTIGYTRTEDAVNLSFGKGLNIAGTFGYMFNKNVGAELGISYLIGGKTTITDKATYTNSSSLDTYNYSASMLRINPTIVVTAGLEGINPYAKFGVIVGFGSYTVDNVSSTTNTLGTTEDLFTEKYSGGMAIGVNAGVGAFYNLSDNLALFGELNMVNLSYAATKSIFTVNSINGEDQLSTMTTSQKETNYVDSYTYDSAATVSTSTASSGQKAKVPFGSFGINIGVKFSF